MGVSENALLARARGYLLRGAVLAALTLLMTLLYASEAWADTFTVANLNDSGPGSLRVAMNAAEANAGADEIVFADGVSGTITLASALPMLTDPAELSIDGGGDVTVSGGGAVQIFRVGDGAALSLRSLTLSGGTSELDQFGGAIANLGGEVMVTNSTISRNVAEFGGAIGNVGGKVVVTKSTISGNIVCCEGGGIYNTGGGSVTIADSTISANSTDQMFNSVGGIHNANGTVEVIKSTFSGNDIGIVNYSTLMVTNSTISANSHGIENNSSRAVVAKSTFSGNAIGIENRSTLEVTGSTFSANHGYAIRNWNAIGSLATLEVTNSTFSGNTGRVVLRCDELGEHCVEIEVPGRAISNGGGTVEVINSTISGNSVSAGNAIFNEADFNGNAGKVTLRSTIVANTTSGDNCGGEVPITDGGYNIDDGGTCGLTQATGSLPNTNPLLDPAGLADNGGPTQTIALLPESPAVDLVGQEACPPPETDQRGVERPQGEACDSGAFELVQGPQTKADCKKGGWEEFGFKNQGQCIASLQKKQSTNG